METTTESTLGKSEKAAALAALDEADTKTKKAYHHQQYVTFRSGSTKDEIAEAENGYKIAFAMWREAKARYYELA